MSNASPFLPYGRHCIDDDDVAAVAAVLRSAALTTGPVVEEFERALAKTTGAKEAVVCNSGTAALHLAAAAAGVGPGDQVIVPAMTFVATANCARYLGADVVFTDVNPNTGLMEPQHFEVALKRAARAKVVIPVHLNGQCSDVAGIKTIAARHDVAVIEDACHAVGGTYPGPGSASVGACTNSRAACFSFHPVKTIAMGEGGAVTTNDDIMAAHMRRLRSHGIERLPVRSGVPAYAFDSAGNPNPWFLEMAEPGWNYRASDINCALGLSQLKKLARFAARRRALVARYDAALKPLAPRVRAVERVGGEVAWHLYVALIDFKAAGKERAIVMRELATAGIGTQVHYFPVHLQPYYQNLYGGQHLPGAQAYYASCLSLPLFPAMTDDDVSRVVNTLKKVVG